MMTSRIAALAALLAFLALAAPAVLAETADVDMTVVKIDPTDRSASPPFGPSRLDIEFAEEAPEGAPAVPEGVEGAMQATRDFAGSPLAILIGKSEAEVDGYDVLYVDMNRDGVFSADEKRDMVPNTRQGRGGPIIMGNALDVPVSLDDATLPFVFAYNLSGSTLRAQMVALWYLNGTFTVGEKTYQVAVRDGNADGDFKDAEDDLWVLREDKPGQRGVSPYGLSATTEKRFLDGYLFSIALNGKKLTVDYAAADGPDEASLSSRRERVEHMWFKRFEPEKESMVERFKIDTSRPLAETPIDWKYLTFEEAKALAKKTGKHLFIDVTAYWCIWCFRMDFYTYPDKEVAKLLNEKFIPVKIFQEEDRVGDYQRLMGILGARGIPAMGIWDSNGEFKRFIGGFKKPTEFVSELNQGLASGDDEEKPGGD